MTQPQHRFPWRLMGLLAAAVIVVTVGAGLLLARSPGTPPAPPMGTATPSSTVTLPVPDGREQNTILLQVRGRDRRVESSILLGFGGDSSVVSALVIPTTLQLPTQPPVTIAGVDGPSGPVGAQQPLGTLLGVRIDETVEMDRLAWAGLIDAIGTSTLRGMEGRDVPGALEPVLGALPADRERVGQLLTSLGSMARTSMPNETTSRLLAALGDRVRHQGLRVQILPVSVVRAGGAPVSLLDPSAARLVIHQALAGAELQPGHAGPVRVIVERGGATTGAFLAVQRRLASAGYAVVPGSAPATSDPLTRVMAAGDSVAGRSRAIAVADALGLPPSAVQADVSPTAEVDVRVVLGSATTGSGGAGG